MEEPTGRELWLRAGQDLLRAGGIGAVKLRALTDRLGLTTGSFYHHFSGMADYLDELARFYGAGLSKGSLVHDQEMDPRERLRRLGAISRDAHLRPLDAAMRDWAGSNELAAEAVRSADEFLLRFIERAFLDLGYTKRESQTRASLYFAAGVARFSPPWRIPTKINADVLAVLAPE